MKQTWRWFGPDDTVRIRDLRQVGVQGVVSALHHLTPGQVWSIDEIKLRQNQIANPEGAAPSGLTWDVVESLTVSEAIKTQSASCSVHITNYCTSLRNLAACGIGTVCYNFMPLLDWTRTTLRTPLPHGGTTMVFDLLDFAVFDLFVLQRPTAIEDYSLEFVEQAEKRWCSMSTSQKLGLQKSIIAGLPGEKNIWTIDNIRENLTTYTGITPDRLLANLIDFLSEVIPVAQSLNLRLCCHPDDPPFALLGLPRIMSTEEDFSRILHIVDIPSNGVTLCTGSLGVISSFDAVGFAERLGSRIHFLHLRSTTRMEPTLASRTSFCEASHLEGDTDVIGVIRVLLDEERRRKAEGRTDWEIPMRPDHGQDLLDDLNRKSMPGYPLIGRMRGLAELRGAIAALT